PVSEARQGRQLRGIRRRRRPSRYRLEGQHHLRRDEPGICLAGTDGRRNTSPLPRRRRRHTLRAHTGVTSLTQHITIMGLRIGSFAGALCAATFLLASADLAAQKEETPLDVARQHFEAMQSANWKKST